ncbi:DNA-damage-inducible protein J [Gammaproteobacteria bacterium]
MTASTLVQAYIDNRVNEEATTVLASVGLTIPDAVRLLLTRIAHDHALPFDPLMLNAETVEAMMEARGGHLPSADTMAQFMAAMNAKD